MPIEIKELQIRVQVPEPNEETALGSPVQIHVDASDNLWIGPGETTPDDLFGTDAGVPDHDSWIDVDATILGGHKSGSDAAGGNLELTVKVLDGASQTGHYTQIIWDETAASAGEVLDAGAGELPGSTQGRGLFVLSTAPLSGHTGGANMLLADGQVTFDPAEFFAADDSAAADRSGAFTVGFGDGSVPHDGPPSGGDVGVAEVDEYIKAGKDASFDPAEFFTPDDSAAADQFGAIMIGFGDGSVRHVGPSATSGHSGSANLVSFDTATPTLPTSGDYVMDYYWGGDPLDSVPPATHAVTERTSGLTYSGESGGLNEAQTVPTRPMSWDNVANKPVVEPYGHVDASGAIWGLDRIDMLDDAAAPFFAYDVGFRGGVNVGASESDAGFGGGVVVAAGDLDGVRPHVFGDFELV